MTRDPNYSPFAARVEPFVARPSEPLWELRGLGKVITCALRDDADLGVEVQMFSSGECRSGRRFATRADAVAFSESERWELAQYVDTKNA